MNYLSLFLAFFYSIRMILSLMVAASEDNVIGKDGRLPWHMPADLRYFREKTKDHAVVMGRKTYESIGHPLPNRTNIILTTQNADKFAGPRTLVFDSFDKAIDYCHVQYSQEEVFVIGGEEIFRLAFPIAHKIYLTRIHASVEGDVRFPAVNSVEWREISRDDNMADADNPYDYTFLVYERRKLLA